MVYNGFFLKPRLFFKSNYKEFPVNHVLSLMDFSGDELNHLVQSALRIKADPAKFRGLMDGRWLLMLFQKTSTRTRLSFEIGVQQLGGKAVVMDWDESNFAISPIKYEARYVSGHVDLVMARLKQHGDVQALVEHSTVPVINGCDDKFHPCQALADIVTVYEAVGTFEGQTLTYTGIHNNVANSLAIACSKIGLNLILCTPEANPAAEDAALMKDLLSTGLIEQTQDLPDAARRSQFVYTDTWVDMEFFHDESYAEEKERRVKKMAPYQLNEENLAGSDAYILHDMPIHPGYEISAELVDSPRALIYQQAANRLYAQQALMLHLLGITG